MPNPNTFFNPYSTHRARVSFFLMLCYLGFILVAVLWSLI